MVQYLDLLNHLKDLMFQLTILTNGEWANGYWEN